MNIVGSKAFHIIFLILVSIPDLLSGQTAFLFETRNYTRPLPLLERILAHSPFVKRSIQSNVEAEDMASEVRSQIRSSRGSRGRNRARFYRNIVRNSLRLLTYVPIWADRQTGIDRTAFVKAKKKKYINLVKKYGLKIFKSKSSRKNKLVGLYHHLMMNYYTGKKAGKSLTRLVEIKGFLPQKLQRNIDLLMAMAFTFSSNTRAMGINQIEKMFGRFSFPDNLVLTLALARAYAGLDNKGKLVGEKNPLYRNQLRSATSWGAKLSEYHRGELVQFSVWVWRQTEGSKASWNNPPLAMEKLGQSLTVLAIRERQAIEQISRRNFIAGLQFYEQISQQFKGIPLEISADLLMLEVAKKKYQLDFDASFFHLFLRKKSQKYFSWKKYPANLGNYVRKGKKQFGVAYFQFTEVITNLALKKNSKELYRSALDVVSAYLQTNPPRRVTISLQSRKAELYFRMRDYQKSVLTYLGLLKQTNRLSFLDAAIKAQKVLAQWPVPPPWKGIPRGSQQNRTQLSKMLKQRVSSQKGFSWISHVDLGLLLVSLDRKGETLKLWTSALRVGPVDGQASKVAGFLLQEYRRLRNWSQIIGLVDVLIQRKIRPTKVNGEPINYGPLYSEALFSLGGTSYKSKKFLVAIPVLQKFVSLFTKDKRRDLALYWIAQSYLGKKQIPQALATLQKLVTQHPQSKLVIDSLVIGGENAVKSGANGLAIFFYQGFVNLFPRDRRVVKARVILGQLFVGEKLYGEASRVYKEQSLAAQASRSEQIKAALAYMDIEEKYGDGSQALLAAARIRQIAKGDHSSLALALGLEARQNRIKKNLRGLVNLEKELMVLRGGVASVRESLGQVRFFIAEMTTQPILNNQQAIAIKNPQNEVVKYFDVFQKYRKGFDKVCSSGMSTFCGPAKLKLASLALSAIKAMEKVIINSSLDATSINNFNLFRQQYVARLATIGSKLDREAKLLAQNGFASDLWKEQILETTANSRFANYVNGL